jgi:hypothetical protein
MVGIILWEWVRTPASTIHPRLTVLLGKSSLPVFVFEQEAGDERFSASSSQEGRRVEDGSAGFLQEGRRAGDVRRVFYRRVGGQETVRRVFYRRVGGQETVRRVFYRRVGGQETVRRVFYRRVAGQEAVQRVLDRRQESRGLLCAICATREAVADWSFCDTCAFCFGKPWKNKAASFVHFCSAWIRLLTSSTR